MTQDSPATLDAATACPTCSRYTCRCGEGEDRWADVRSALPLWSEAIASNA